MIQDMAEKAIRDFSRNNDVIIVVGKIEYILIVTMAVDLSTLEYECWHKIQIQNTFRRELCKEMHQPGRPLRDATWKD